MLHPSPGVTQESSSKSVDTTISHLLSYIPKVQGMLVLLLTLMIIIATVLYLTKLGQLI